MQVLSVTLVTTGAMSVDMSGANFAHRYSVDTRRRWSEDEKQAIKGGRIPKDWKDKSAKLRQKMAFRKQQSDHDYQK